MNFKDLPPDLLKAMEEMATMSDDDKLSFMSGFSQQSDLSIAGLKKNHINLCQVLEEFELVATVKYIASLDLLPELQDHTLRIQVLLILAITSCKGVGIPTLTDLSAWVGLLRKSRVASLEDPPEDVFVGYICTADKGYRFFPGKVSHADFILERLLLLIHEQIDFPAFSDAYENVIQLLKLSEEMAQRLNLPRYYVDDKRSEQELCLPIDSRIDQYVIANYFTNSQLAEIGIEVEKLHSFIFQKEHEENLEQEELFGSTIEKCPILQDSDGITIASPSSLWRAAVTHILEATPKLGGWADTFFEVRSAEFFVNEVLQSIDVKPLREIKLPRPDECLPPLYPCVGEFDEGMPVLAFTKSSSVVAGSNLEEGETFTEEQVESFTDYIAECCKVLEDLPGFKGGLILLSLSSVGRPIMLGLKDLRPSWHLYSAPLADWCTLATDHEFTARRLWYLGLQQDMAIKANIAMPNISGFLNLYGHWKEQQFTLIPESFSPENPHNMMLVGGDHSQPVNMKLKQTSDRHCRWHPVEGDWIEIRRRSIGLNPDLETNLIYGDFTAVTNGELRCCVVSGERSWWVESKRPPSPEVFDTLYQLWDCVSNWCERISISLAREQCDWLPEQAVIQLETVGIKDWNLDNIPNNITSNDALSFHTDLAKGEVYLKIKEDFLPLFHQPQNIAERQIVAVVLKAFAEICGKQASEEEIESMVWNVVKDENTRFFHVVRAQSLETFLAKGKANPLLIPDEEMARISVGLAHKVTPTPLEAINDNVEARKFIGSIVAHIQERLCRRLSKVSLLSVVSHCFDQLDHLSRDGFRWSLSTKSLLAFSDQAAWLQEHLREVKGRTTLAEVTNRALIETAVYSCSPSTENHISQTEHLTMLAEIATILNLSGYREAIANDLIMADITISPNGKINYDDTFQATVMQPYLTSRMNDDIKWDVDAYQTYFSPIVRAENPGDPLPEVVALETAFLAEYGFAYAIIPKFIDVICDFAVKSGNSGGQLEDIHLRQILKTAIGLTDQQVDVFLDRFVLRIRSSWNKDLPDGYELNDVRPWRFYRALSVLVRPIVEVNSSPSVYAISATHLHRWHRYFTNSLLETSLPDRVFTSDKMKKYFRSVAKKKGAAFEVYVKEEMENHLGNVQKSVKMRSLGKSDANHTDDVDVLAWSEQTGVVFLIECKHLKPVLTVAQVINLLEKYRGDQASSKDYLAKHLRRVNWIKDNPLGISNLTGIPIDQIRWEPLLITNGRVPMSFFDAINYPKERVLAVQDLEHEIPIILEK